MKKVIGLFFLVIGVLLIIYPYYKEREYNKELHALEEAFALIADTEEKEVDLSKIENLSFPQDVIENTLELEIPHINMKHLVLDETTDDNLNIALTQIKKDQIPGVGNFTIAGHRGYRDGRHFSNLAKVPIGEIAYLHTKDKTYAYKIISSDVIEETAIEVLNDHEGKKELTLITCTVSGKERVAVKGTLVEIFEK